MNEIKNGNVEFNGIVISGLDTLTDVLQKNETDYNPGANIISNL